MLALTTVGQAQRGAGRRMKRSAWGGRRLGGIGAALTVILGAIAGTAATTGAAHAASQGPCDIYAAGGTPCVAAHSTTRALYGSYSGSLYQVKRWSDGSTTNVGVLAAGGYANAATQDNFCSGTYCTIVKIYDQTSHHNDLSIA